MTEFASAQGFPDAKTVLAKHRMPIALSVSLLVHALLLSLSLGGNGFGLPGLQLPWKERRLEADQLRILLTMTRSGASEPAADDTASAGMPLPERPAADESADAGKPATGSPSLKRISSFFNCRGMA